MSLFALPQKYYILSASGGYDETGKYVGTDWTELDYNGTIQPLKSDELANFDVGEKNKGMVKTYSDRELPLPEQGDETSLGALILFNGKYYKLVSEGTYKSGIINHYKYFAVLYNKEVTVI